LTTFFLDRDGVLNEKMPEGSYVRSPAEFRPLAGVAEAIARLNRAGKRVIVVSNQRGVSKSLYTAADVNAIHQVFQSWLQNRGAHVDGFYFCPHDKAQCNCRKPLTGMFDQAVADFPAIQAATSAMVGDSLSDIEFGHRLGMMTVFIEGGAEQRKHGADAARELAYLRFSSLLEAVDALVDELGVASS
jgi:D-glycero-D-manno-heptose 1,7-bisphosphate phosphatase